ncbi:MAG: hypothetical protein JW790_00575 [Dehalococcoidales bacterium]|nr:hypothetical protein [Dehalococcoidales bacterium]
MVKALLVASVVLLSLPLCSCSKEKPTTEELLMAYDYSLTQLADYAAQSSQEAEEQASQGEITSDELAVRYQEITLIWAQTIAEMDRGKQYRELWPLIYGGNEPPTLVKQPTNPDLLQWTNYITQVEEYIFMHHQLVDAAWKKLGYSQ